MGKPASQSGTYINPPYNHDAAQGNNGDRTEEIAWTQKTVNPWWQVDLGGCAQVLRVAVKYILITYLEIRVGDDGVNGGINNNLCTASTLSVLGPMTEFICPSRMQGRYVSVHKKGDSILILYEVEVYGIMQQSLQP